MVAGRPWGYGGAMTARIVLFGATGYSGRLTAERLVAHGERPCSQAARRRASPRWRSGSGLDWRTADAPAPGVALRARRTGDVLVTTVGPFARWGDAAVRAAIAAPAVYLDSTGEPAFIRRVAEELGPPAARAGATLMPAMGFDYVPGALAATLALAEAGEDAERVDIGYFTLGAGPGMMSRGTAVSLVGAALEPDVRVPRRRAADRAGGRARARLPRARPRPDGAVDRRGRAPVAARRPPGLREVNVYAGDAGPAAHAAQAASALTAVATRVPGVRTALRLGAEQLAGLLPAPAPGTTPGARSWIAAVASDGAGRALAEVSLGGANPYAFTAGFSPGRPAGPRTRASSPRARSGRSRRSGSRRWSAAATRRDCAGRVPDRGQSSCGSSSSPSENRPSWEAASVPGASPPRL